MFAFVSLETGAVKAELLFVWMEALLLLVDVVFPIIS